VKLEQHAQVCARTFGERSDDRVRNSENSRHPKNGWRPLETYRWRPPAAAAGGRLAASLLAALRRCRRHGALCVHGVSVSRIEPIIVAQPLRSIQRKLQPMGHACNGRESVASGGHASSFI
jgi:hypothetical protein